MSQTNPPNRLRLRETALASGLLSADQLDLAEDAVKLMLDPQTASASEWDKALADVVVGWGWVTRFQADQMRDFSRTVFRLGQYTVLDEIGKGGMGQVFRAEHAMMGRQVAVKVLPRAKATPESEKAFQREMRVLGRLDHENLVRAFDAGYEAKVYYLVTELVPGVDLKQLVKERGPLDETTAAVIIAQAARALGYAHDQQVVHRDVKPGNILVLPDMRVKVLDLGLAGSQVAEEAMRLGRIVGTMDYIAPEQTQSPDDVGPAADIYALGCTLYYAVTGQVPFPGGSRKEKVQKHLNEVPQPAHEVKPEISEAFSLLIEDMMAKSVEDRIRSAAEVIQRLQPWLTEGRRRPKASRFTTGDPLAATGMASFPSDDSSSFWNALIPPAPPRSGGLLGSLLPPALMAKVNRIVRAARSAALVAVPIGAFVGAALMFVRNIDPTGFDKLLSKTAPVQLGCLVFLVMFILQIVVAVRSRS